MAVTNHLKLTLFILTTVLTVDVCGQSINGKASYYHNSLHGRKMSNGQPYDRNRMTCAHRTLPFGTKLRVTNSTNGKQVIVEVTDRGPFVKGRVIDLSYAAARELGTIAAGVGYVQIEILPDGVTIPFQSDGSPFDLPEVEYGMAGVCYEFIPEWKEEKGTNTATAENEDNEGADEPADDSRVTATENNAKPQAATKTEPKKTAAPQNATAARQSQKTSRQQPKEAQKPSQKGASKTWSDFFEKMKSLF